jgi:penicillin amidase
VKNPTLRSLLFLSLSLLLIVQAMPHASGQAPAAANPAEVSIKGLRDRVRVRRDERGIPYIEATNETDLYFAQGFVTASDRLWQMDLLRRSMRGELSEVLGRSVLSEDKRRRTFGIAQLSEQSFAQTSGPVRAALESYANGVNAYIASINQDQLPPEFKILQYTPRPWTPADSLAIGKLFAEALSTTWSTDLMRAAFADLPKEKRDLLLIETSPLDVLVVGKESPGRKASRAPGKAAIAYNLKDSVALLNQLSQIKETTIRSLERVGLYMEDRAVSNNWVVSGARTADGKPMLANDPHLPALVPSIWHMVHLSMPGLRVAGVTSPGAPGVILGHNDHIAWGATNLAPDVQDLYLEKFDQANPKKYQTPRGWSDAEVRREEIKIRKGFGNAETEIEPFDVTVTRHGPIIFEKDGARYALRWTALDPSAIEFTAFYDLNRAHNWDEFRSALSKYGGPTQNFVFASRDGHIGYYGAGRIPIRKSGEGTVPYDGATDAGEWTSYIPFDKLPHVYDPPEGFIVTANQRVAGGGYSQYLTREWAAPHRARRIFDLLQAKSKLTPSDMRDIQADTYSIANASFAREVVKVAGDQSGSVAPGDEKWRETLALFAAWDGRMDSDSRAAVIAALMRLRFRQRVVEAALGLDRAKGYDWSNSGSFVDRMISERPRDWLPSEFKNYLELLRACERDVREGLTKKLGADETQWTWGRYEPVKLRHPLASAPLIGLQFAIAPFPLYGSGSSINVGQSVSMRLIATPNNWDETRQGIALGVSGNPASPHFKDQLDDWRSANPRVFPFSEAAVEKAAKESMVLVPAK